MTTGGKNGPEIVFAEQSIRRLFHERQVRQVRADAAEDAKNQLNEEWWLDEFPVDDVREVVEVTDVVALVLEPAAVLLSQDRQNPGDVPKGVLEDEVFGRAEIRLFPVVLPRLIPFRQRVERKVHAAHVE